MCYCLFVPLGDQVRSELHLHNVFLITHDKILSLVLYL